MFTSDFRVRNFVFRLQNELIFNWLEVDKTDKIDSKLGQTKFTQSLTKISAHIRWWVYDAGIWICGNMTRDSTYRREKIFFLLLYAFIWFSFQCLKTINLYQLSKKHLNLKFDESLCCGKLHFIVTRKHSLENLHKVLRFNTCSILIKNYKF